MDKKEFSEITTGITAAKIAELTARSLTTIQSYLSGRSKIPYEVAQFALNLKKILKDIKLEGGTVNSRKFRKVIGGKLYDTQSATMLAAYANNLGNRDLHDYREELYRTKNGAYFLAGDGNGLTRYAKNHGKSTGGSEDIFPITEAEAREWMEQYGDADEYEAAFEVPPEA